MINYIEEQFRITQFIPKFLFWMGVIIAVFILLFKIIILHRFDLVESLIFLNLGNLILFITFLALAWYSWETRGMRKEMIKQTQLEQMPIVMLYIRKIKIDQKNVDNKLLDYLVRIRTEKDYPNYYLSTRNIGKGSAFNLKISSNRFDIVKYNARFLAPTKDEQPFSICENGNKKIESWDKFKDSVFEIECSDLLKNKYIFKYKIIDLINENVQYLGFHNN